MAKIWNQTWQRLSFLTRLLLTASIALVLAGGVMLLVSARQEAREARDDIAKELAAALSTLPGVLSDAVVIGDYADLQQHLDRFVRRPYVASATYLDEQGGMLESRDRPLPVRAPAWFSALLDFHDQGGHASVSVGGHVYGELGLVLTAQNHTNRAWQQLLDQIGILLLALALDCVGIWLVLRGGLAPLTRLEQGAVSLAQGNLATRLPVEGGPELRHLIRAFNRMAEAVQHGQGELEKSNAELRRFAEIAAHHLQEPTRRLASFAQRLRGQIDDANLNEDARVSLEFIETQARRQQSLIRDVQRYLAAGEARGEVAAVDTAAVLNGVLATLAEKLRSAEIEIGELPKLRLDRPRLAELFTLLLDNACRHGDSGQPVRIQVRGVLEAGVAHLEIIDHGPGIPAEYRERVFRVFERLKNHHDGNGSGLAIVRRIVESVGGRAWITETPGGGCTVNCEIPSGVEPR